MTTAQKIIKYLAIAFALFLIVTIFSAILGGLYAFSGVLGLKKNKEITNELHSLEWENNEVETSYLDIDIAYSKLIIKTGETFIAETNNSNIKCKQYGNKLKIEEKSHKLTTNNNNEELIVYIPQGLEFKNVEIDSGAGIVDIENIITSKLKLNLGAGETIIRNINADDAEIDTGAGKLTIESGIINNLDFDMGVGKTEITAKLTGRNEIDTGIGSLKLNLQGFEEDYKIRVSKGIGSIKIDDNEVSNDTTVGNGDTIIDLDGGIGESIIKYYTQM